MIAEKSWANAARKFLFRIALEDKRRECIAEVAESRLGLLPVKYHGMEETVSVMSLRVIMHDDYGKDANTPRTMTILKFRNGARTSEYESSNSDML